MLENALQPGTIQIDCHVILGTIKLRSGEPDALYHLQEAKVLGFKTKEHHRIIPVVIVLLEHEWISSVKILLDEELNHSIELVKKVNSIFLNNAFAFWLNKTRNQELRLADQLEPYKFLQTGKIGMAASFWQQVGCPYEKAFALFQGKEQEKMEGLSIFLQLGANAVVERSKMEMRAAGIKTIPRGPRPSTKANPAQLTNREIDVLQLLQKGIPNKEIAGTLFISPKTTEHHISSILFKLDVNSRLKAVDEAIRLGILK